MAQMSSEDYMHVVLYAILGVLYLVSCIRLALWHSRRGRSFEAWLLITFFLTAIPTLVLIWRRGSSRQQEHSGRAGRLDRPSRGRGAKRPFRCPHCNRLVVAPDSDAGSGITTCPHCGLPTGEAPAA